MGVNPESAKDQRIVTKITHGKINYQLHPSSEVVATLLKSHSDDSK